MAIDWPNDDQQFPCPHCKTHSAAFTTVVHQSWSHASTEDESREIEGHTLDVMTCRSCGMPIVRHEADPQTGEEPVTTIYPKAASRALAPAEVQEKSPQLAQDYNEAVECEPFSMQASVILLGRCVERILNEEAECDEDATLGPKINDAMKREAIPTYIATSLQKGFLVARNFATHIWTNATGEQIQVDEYTLDKCFGIVDELFRHFYVYPQHASEFIEKMSKAKEDKQSK